MQEKIELSNQHKKILSEFLKNPKSLRARQQLLFLSFQIQDAVWKLNDAHIECIGGDGIEQISQNIEKEFRGEIEEDDCSNEDPNTGVTYVPGERFAELGEAQLGVTRENLKKIPKVIADCIYDFVEDIWENAPQYQSVLDDYIKGQPHIAMPLGKLIAVLKCKISENELKCMFVELVYLNHACAAIASALCQLPEASKLLSDSEGCKDEINKKSTTASVRSYKNAPESKYLLLRILESILQHLILRWEAFKKDASQETGLEKPENDTKKNVRLRDTSKGYLTPYFCCLFPLAHKDKPQQPPLSTEVVAVSRI